MKRTVIILLIIASLAAVASADSIWARRQTTTKSLYVDDKATQIGDILTVIISEDSKIDNAVSRDLAKKSSRSLTLDHDMYLDDPPMTVLPNIPGITNSFESSSDKSLNGTSDYSDERSFVDQMTVVVEDVFPNGNLLIIGTRERDVAGDKQTIQLSGIVRPRDISFSNTISSAKVANFRLVTINEGVTEKYNEPGWLGQILDSLWPF